MDVRHVHIIKHVLTTDLLDFIDGTNRGRNCCLCVCDVKAGSTPVAHTHKQQSLFWHEFTAVSYWFDCRPRAQSQVEGCENMMD